MKNDFDMVLMENMYHIPMKNSISNYLLDHQFDLIKQGILNDLIYRLTGDKNLFFNVSVVKSKEILKTLQVLIGKDNWLKGIKNYFTSNAASNFDVAGSKLDNFIGIMEKVF